MFEESQRPSVGWCETTELLGVSCRHEAAPTTQRLFSTDLPRALTEDLGQVGDQRKPASVGGRGRGHSSVKGIKPLGGSQHPVAPRTQAKEDTLQGGKE